MNPFFWKIVTKIISDRSLHYLKNFRILGYKSSKTLYRLLNRYILDDYIYLEHSGRVYLMLEPPNLPNLTEKIRANIQLRKNNIIKRVI